MIFKKEKKENFQDISLSIYKKRWLKFKMMKRGYYSFFIITILYLLSWFLPLLVNSKALIVKHEGKYYFPAIHSFALIPGRIFMGNEFGQDVPGEANYRLLQKKWYDENSDNWILMPPYPFDPLEGVGSQDNARWGLKMYSPPSSQHWLGTDDTGRDVFSRLVYAFNISITFEDQNGQKRTIKNNQISALKSIFYAFNRYLKNKQNLELILKMAILSVR